MTVTEKWSPIEVAVFEAAITLYGKNFSMIQKYVRRFAYVHTTDSHKPDAQRNVSAA
jgi:hypothetical protein